METIMRDFYKEYLQAQSNNDLIRTSFWSAKTFQQYPLHEDKRLCEFVNVEIPTLSSFVSRAFIDPNTLVPNDYNCFDSVTGLLVWERIRKCNFISEEEITMEEDDESLERKEYIIICKKIQQLGLHIHSFISQKSMEEMYQIYGQPSLLSKLNYYLGVYDLLLLSREGKSHLAFTIGVSQLERFLGDLVNHIHFECPKMLKDVLPLLIPIFNQDIEYFLSAIIGPPAGLNLRNIVWHGFMDNNTFSDSYFSLLLVITLSLNNELQKKNFNYIKRPLLNFGTPSPSLYSLAPQKSSFFETLSEKEMKWFHHIFSRSYFIKSKTSTLAIQAIDFFHQKKYGEFVCIILPLLEQSIRKIYACINPSLSPSVLVAAAARVHFTTLDLFIKEFLESPNDDEEDTVIIEEKEETKKENEKEFSQKGEIEEEKVKENNKENMKKKENLKEVIIKSEINNLVYEIGKGPINLMWDLFTHVSGPRIRDHISHCDSDMSTIPHLLAERILQLFSFFCIKYTHSPSLQDFSILPDSFKQCYHFVNNYTSCFHPQSFLCRNLVSLSQSWKSVLDNINFPNIADVIEGNEQEFSKYISSPLLYEKLNQINSLLTVKIKLKNLNSFFEFHPKETKDEKDMIENEEEKENEEKENEKNEEKLYQEVLSFIQNSKTLYCSPLEMQLIFILEKIGSQIIIFSNSFVVKLTEGSTKAKKGELTRGQYATFLKIFGHIDCIYLCITSLCLLYQESIVSDEKLTIKKLKRMNIILSTILRMKSKLEDNQWHALSLEIENITSSIHLFYT